MLRVDSLARMNDKALQRLHKAGQTFPSKGKLGWVLCFLFLSAFGWSQAFSWHVVQKGESLFGISKRYGISQEAIIQANQITDPKKIKVGQKLKIPAREGSGIPLKSDPPPKTEIKRDSPSPEIKKNDESDGRYLFITPVKHLIDLPKIPQGKWKYIVVHHSATTSGNAAIFDLAHRRRGMENGLAYHFVIGNGRDSKDGEIEVGNRWLKQLKGGHVRSESLNQISVGICFVGNFEEGRPSRRQMAAAIELIHYLRNRIGTPYPEFRGHREINPLPTSCPGRFFPLKAFHQIFDSEK